MKYYRHTMTMREQLQHQRRQDRAQAGFDFIAALLLCLAVYALSVMVLS
jgi:hypothetical protein